MRKFSSNEVAMAVKQAANSFMNDVAKSPAAMPKAPDALASSSQPKGISIGGKAWDSSQSTGAMAAPSMKMAWANKPSGAEQQPAEPSEAEYQHRKNRVRKILGTIVGMGYGGFVGSIVGKELLHAPLGVSAATGATAGGLAGLGVGTALGHIERYTGQHKQPSTVQLIIPGASPDIAQRVEEALGTKQAAQAWGRTLHHFVKQADRHLVMQRVKDWLKEKLERSNKALHSTMLTSPPSIGPGDGIKAV